MRRVDVASASSTIAVMGANVGNAISRKVLVIGDSTTANGICIGKLNDNFNTDVMDIQTIGSLGTTPNKHEGRSGWTANLYVTVASSLDGNGVAVNNAFWNPGTSAFDFSYYMTQNAFSSVDYVVINLGINDMFSFNDDASLNATITNVLSQYQTMINSITAYNANIKIGIALTIPPNYSQDAFGKSYSSGQYRARYKRNNILWVNKVIQTYQNME
jgi:lysophospholipase L1-like esterase